MLKKDYVSFLVCGNRKNRCAPETHGALRNALRLYAGGLEVNRK